MAKSKGTEQQNTDILTLDDNAGLEVFQNDIEIAISEWMEDNNVDDILTMELKQPRWYDLCYYVQRAVFVPNRQLLRDIPAQHNDYSKDKVLKILDYYIRLCYRFGIVVNIKGFSEFSGIERSTLNNWTNDSRFTSSRLDVAKKLSEEREESLFSLLIADKGIPTKYLAALNKYHGWNMPGVRQDKSEQKSIEASEILNALPTIDAEIK